MSKIILVATESHLELHVQGIKKINPIYVDFLSGPLAHRRLFGGGRKSQLIARAIGMRSIKNPRVLDLTAGLGRDAFILATLGCHVTMIERNPMIAALLKDGLSRASHHAEFRDLHLELIEMQAKDYLHTLADSDKNYDVIYLDPMYPDEKRSAQAKKEMRILREVVGKDEDAPELLALALQQKIRRVIVKRPRLAPALTGPKPDIIYTGKSSRFDVYTVVDQGA